MSWLDSSEELRSMRRAHDAPPVARARFTCVGIGRGPKYNCEKTSLIISVGGMYRYN